MTDSSLERVYQFELSDYADKVEIYDSPYPSRLDKHAHMAIREDKALELIETMLTEIEQ